MIQNLVLFIFILLFGGCSDDKPLEKQGSSFASTQDSEDNKAHTKSTINLNVKKHVSPKGIVFWHVNDPKAPVVSVVLSFKQGGVAYDPASHVGVGDILARMLLKGSHKRNEKQLREFLDDRGASIAFAAGLDTYEMFVTALAEDFPDLVLVAEDLLKNPRLGADDLAIIKERELAQIAMKRASSQYQLGKLIRKTLYADHPYGRLVFDTPEDIHRITSQDLVEKLHSLSQTNVVATIVGNLSAEKAGEYLDRMVPFAHKRSSVSACDAWVIPEAVGSDPYIIPEEVPQCTVVGVMPGIPLKHKDALGLQILMGILEKRLWKEVRERRGLAYVVNAYTVRQEKSGNIRVLFSTANHQVYEALQVVKDVLHQVHTQGITPDELLEGVRRAQDSHVMGFTTTYDTARVLHGYRLQGKSKSYVNHRHDKLETLDLGTLQELSKKYIHPDRMHVFIHGSPGTKTGE